MVNSTIKKAADLLDNVREKNPLIHNITNYVTVNDCANILLAIGASPIMADDLREVSDIVSISSALVINIGTLNERTVESMLIAGKKANELNIPIILDPVGAGASNFRNSTVKAILDNVKVSIIRGNISEIKFISGLKSYTKGVDAGESDLNSESKESETIVYNLAKNLECIVAITGVYDVISDGDKTVILSNGTKMLSKVTGSGCMTTALIGAYAGAAYDDLFSAAVAGILTMSIAGEISIEKNGKKGTGNFHIGIIDAVSNMTSMMLKRRGKIETPEN
ncbi:hydroxyethylthiazole kinase [Clostridium sp. BJN0001]|uniref:hydroxyethylthiazole kinase n=1 Tax=Clostridium sp. BJN0001 TaxID=2930219 RepID=UPI001FD4F907|nr:hydroxyethylthiazole kinase [Clostridium sp. BJN0001]